MTDELNNSPKVLIVSWSPIPTPKYQKIEGSGQRFYGLACGLKKNGVKDITIAIGAPYPLDVKEVNGFKLFNYDLNEAFAERLKHFDTIIFNYTIHGSAFVAKHIPIRTQVIIDAYGPAYIENLAREPEDLVATYVGNLGAVNEVFNKVLPRGDYFLYANDAQEKFYSGVLATLGVINQFSYKTDRLLHVPFGIDNPTLSKHAYKNPYLEYGIKKDDFVLLWFGGLYPWFDITPILETLKSKTKNIKFVIVGGNNPQNQHPDFVKHYKQTLSYIEKNELGDRVTLIDWVDFATRRKYYEFADVIISMNGSGRENAYSWRTRVMDYVGSDTPLITNGGDPLSDELVEAGAAFKVDAHDADSIKRTIESLADGGKLKIASKKMRELQPKYYWENVTGVLARKIIEQSKPFDDEQNFRLVNAIHRTEGSVAHATATRLSRVKPIARTIARKVRTDGPKKTYLIAHDKVKRRLAHELHNRNLLKTKNASRIVIIANQLNNTGAPFVIVDMVKKMTDKFPSLAKSIKFIAFTPIDVSNVIKLKRVGVVPEIYTNRELGLSLHDGDVVVLNSFAISHVTAISAIKGVKDGTVRKLYWYGHESSPEGFVDAIVKKEMAALLKSGKAKVYSVSEATLREYARFFGTDENVSKMTFPFSFPEDMFRVRKPADFNELKFVLIGSMMDMRKGQYPILYAFIDFYHNHYTKNPSKYRNFHIEFIGAYEKTDLTPSAAYHVRNIKKQFDLSAIALGDHYSITPGLSHEEVLKKVAAANVTVCYSLTEALGIFVYEGMATGHPIIRNESAGQEEQLQDGVNGYAVSSADFPGLVAAIEKMLNKSTTTNEMLAKMSQVSFDIARQAMNFEYQIIDDIRSNFGAKNKKRY